MNVSLRKHLYYLLCLALLPLSPLRGQSDNYKLIELETYTNQSVSYIFSALEFPQPVQLNPTPAHGSVVIKKIASQKYELTYTPNADFIGEDQFRIGLAPDLGCPFCQHVWDFKITVELASIVANHDYAFGKKNTSLSINVLQNDESSNGIKELTVIPLSNNGEATFSPGATTIEFTPEVDFEGVAYVNYVICNGNGLCDNGTVTIQVLGDNVNVSDTLVVFTKKNSPQVILIPNTFTLSNEPAHGTYDVSGDAPQYIPDEDFAGTDLLYFQSGNTRKVVQVIVLDVVDNMFAYDDEAYTTPNTSVEVNVLENDRYGSESGCFSIATQPQYGVIEYDEELGGLVTYKPSTNFTGVDWFTYRVNTPDCSGSMEMATAYIYVSNFEPSSSKFLMFTPKRTPLIVGNNVPISNFKYKIKEQGDLGTVLFLEGLQNTVIEGKQISGNNMIIYIPNEGVDSGIDEFEISYCVTGSNETQGCAYEKSVKIEVNILNVGNGVTPSCFDDCVWPGDTNLDGVVSVADLLPIGLAMGEIGTPRTEVDMDVWYGQYGENWEEEVSPNVDLKHIDTDGDSIVSALDTMAISHFYGNVHGITSVSIPFSKNSIFLKGDVFVNPGDLVELDIIMGSEDFPANNVYGFTFPFEYTPLIFDSSTVKFDFYKASWLTYNSPVAHMQHNNEEGFAEAAFTRTSGFAVSGFGIIGKLSFVVKDDLEGFRPGDGEIIVPVGGNTATFMDGSGQRFGLNVGMTNIHIVLPKPAEIKDAPLTDDLLKVYPNPAQNLLNIHLNGGQEFEQIQVFNLTGQLVFDSGKTLARRMQIDVSNFQNGIYILTARSGKGVVKKKFEVISQ